MEIKRPISRFPLPANARKVFSGKIFSVYQWDQPMFDGTTEVFEKLERPDTVVIVPVTTEDKIVLVTEEQPNTQPKMKVPTGRLEPGEDPISGAARELLEETGYQAKSWKLWKVVEPMNKIEWVIYMLIAQGCEKVAEPHLDAGERISSQEVTWEEFVGLSSEEEIFERELTYEILKAKVSPEGLGRLRDLVLK